MIIKTILIVGLALAGLFAYRAGRGARSLALRRVGFSMAMALCFLAVLAPAFVSKVAVLVGVGRGTDLVLYIFVLASLFIWIGLYRRLHDMEERFVALARQIALGKVSLPELPPADVSRGPEPDSREPQR